MEKRLNLEALEGWPCLACPAEPSFVGKVADRCQRLWKLGTLVELVSRKPCAGTHRRTDSLAFPLPPKLVRQQAWGTADRSPLGGIHLFDASDGCQP